MSVETEHLSIRNSELKPLGLCERTETHLTGERVNGKKQTLHHARADRSSAIRPNPTMSLAVTRLVGDKQARAITDPIHVSALAIAACVHR